MVGSSNWKGQCSNWSWGRAERYFCLWAKIILGTIHEFGSPVSTEYQWKGEVLILEATWMFKNVKEIQTRWQHPQKFDFQKTLLFSPSSPSCDLPFPQPFAPRSAPSGQSEHLDSTCKWTMSSSKQTQLGCKRMHPLDNAQSEQEEWKRYHSEDKTDILLWTLEN